MQLLASPEHRYAGRPGPLGQIDDETVDRVEIRAGLGIVGDRYFNRPAHRDASVTVLAAESLAPWPGTGLREARRNILLRGVSLDDAVDDAAGRVLSLDTGDGPVLLHVRRPARPCAWLDVAVGPGAWRALRGRGGMRCEPLTGGVLRVGPVDVRWTDIDAVRRAGS